jgi:hypothetical protein
MTRSMMLSVGGVSVVTGWMRIQVDLGWADERWIQNERSEVDQHLGSAHTGDRPAYNVPYQSCCNRKIIGQGSRNKM